MLTEIVQAKESKLTAEQKQLFGRHRQILKTREAQLLMTLFVIENQHTDFKEEYSKMAEPLGSLQIPYESVKNGVNLAML